MNKYLEKIASFEKQAFDTDYDDDNEYGVASNRSIGNSMVHDVVSKAAKDPSIHVTVDGYSNKHNPKEFAETMAEIKSKVGNKTAEQHDKDRTMQWHRDHVWSIGMAKDHPHIKKLIGKENEWGETMDASSAIYHHLGKKGYL